MDPNSPYFRQVDLLVQMLPAVAKYDCFALKGGTAINLFVRDMPRLSVDIDLTKLLPGLRVAGSKLSGTNTIYKLLTQLGNTQVKIEISPVMRGVVNAMVQLETSG